MLIKAVTVQKKNSDNKLGTLILFGNVLERKNFDKILPSIFLKKGNRTFAFKLIQKPLF